MLGFGPVGSSPVSGGSSAFGPEPASALAPTFQAVGGTEKSNRKALSISWPTHQQYDVGWLLLESNAGEVVTLATPSGFAEMAGSPFTAPGAGTQLSVFWCRATSNSMPKVVTSVPTDHMYGFIATARGCIQAGDPWDVFASGAKTVASTSVSASSVTTTDDNRLVLVVLTKDLDSGAAFASSYVNGNLAELSEDFDAGTTLGNGGGIALAHGTKNFAGATGSTAITVTSSRNAYFTVALKPPLNVSVGLTGAQLIVTPGALGPFTGDAAVTLAAGLLQAQPGAVVPSGDAPVSVGGAGLSTQVGAVQAETAVIVGLAGEELVASGGIIDPVLNVEVVPAGHILAAQRGVLSQVATGTTDGVILAAQAGAVAIAGACNVAAIGAQLAAQRGAVGFGVTVELVGRALAASGRAVSPAAGAGVSLAGASLVAAPGAAAATGGSGVQDVTVGLTGTELAAQFGLSSTDILEKQDAQLAVVFSQPTIVLMEGLTSAV